MELFTPNRALLNPKFEGYKLDPIPQEAAVTRYNLEYRPTQTTTSGRSPLSFQEVQSRITHNHLAVATHGGRALYVDAEFRVVLIDVDLTTLRPVCRVVCELPRPIGSSLVESPHREYPSAAFLDPRTAFVADGHGCMYILDLPETGTARLVGLYELPAENAPETSALSFPFRLHYVIKISDVHAHALLSSRTYKSAEEHSSVRQKHTSAEFDVWAVQFDLSVADSSCEARKMHIVWHRKGEDVPIFTTYDESRKAYLLIASTIYRDIATPPPPSYDPSPDELAPIPRQHEDLDVQPTRPEEPSPYSWTQTSDSVTVAFPVPSTTPKSDIKVTFSPGSITVHVQGESISSMPLPHYSLKALWDGIIPSSSYWTWDREAEHSFGLLTIYLDKQHEGTKWTQVFASVGVSESSPEDVEVPETLDPSELWQIREALEKYTSAVREGEDASGFGLGRGMPSLSQGEMDDEVDSSVGRTAYLTWVGIDGASPPWGSAHPDIPFTLLSTALPGSMITDTSIIVKSNLDGTLFSLDLATSPENAPTWTHRKTFSALSFVLASKQDTRFTHHVSSEAVLAFESGLWNRGGNIFIYRGANGSEKWAKQTVLKAGDGSLLGVGAMKTVAGKFVLLCLTEGELVLLRDVV